MALWCRAQPANARGADALSARAGHCKTRHADRGSVPPDAWTLERTTCWLKSVEGSMRAAAVVLGLIFAVMAIVYWLVPAGSLPGFFPGFVSGGARVPVNYGIAAASVADVLFAYAWWPGRTRS